MKNRICIFSFAYGDGLLSEDDIYKLKELKNYSRAVIVIVPQKISEDVKSEITRYASEIIPCDDRRLSDCLEMAAKRILQGNSREEIDEIVFLDNSFYGPFGGFGEIFDAAERNFPDADLWGIQGYGSEENGYAGSAFYIDPSFIAMRKRLFTDPYFEEHCKALYSKRGSNEPNKFTSVFTAAGFTAKSIFRFSQASGCSERLNAGVSVIEKAFFNGTFSDIVSSAISSDIKPALDIIGKISADTADRIYSDMISSHDPFELLSKLGNHFVVSENRKLSKNNEAVIVFHMYYEDQMEENLKLLAGAAEAVDVIVTTTSEEKTHIIKGIIENYPALKNAPVLVSMGRGRDMAALLVEARSYLKKYKYIGFTHDKRSAHHRAKSGEDFKRIIIENIVPSSEYIAGVIDLFEENRRLGLLVPPAPEHEKYFAVTGRRWAANFSYYEELCRKLGISVTADPAGSAFALGTAFWCRYEALRELFEYDWKHDDFPPEPLPLNGSLSHAIERAFPYIAKKNGYCSGVIYSREFASMYLCSREYMLTDIMTMLNNCLSAEGQTYSEYKGKYTEHYTGITRMSAELKALKKRVRIVSRSKFFDRKWYLQHYPEVKLSGMSPAEHYFLLGWKEGRLPSAEFADERLLPIWNDAVSDGINPVYLYEMRPAFRRRIDGSSGDYRPHRPVRDIKRKLGLFFCKGAVKRNSRARILVILHLFYMSSWKEIKEYLHNLDVYGYKLIVSYTSDIVDRDVLDDIKEYKPEAELHEFPNLGYDVGSFTDILREVDTAEFDIIFKLQSKGVSRPRIFIYGQYLKRRDWFLNLFEGCIGAFTVHRTIDKLMNDKAIGLAAADNLIVPDPVHKQNMVKAFMTERGITVPDKYLFVAGTCFAVRAELMKPIKEMGLDISCYSQAGNGFSLAHKMERLICLTVLSGGYEFYGNRVLTFRRAFRKLDPDYHMRKKYSGMRLLRDKRFTLDDEFVFFNLEHRLVKKYEIVELPLKDIKRNWADRQIPLSECHPYRYLQTGDPKVYEEYCRLNKELHGLDIMSKERFDKLIRSIEENGFDSDSIIVVNKDNVIADGQHRCCYLMYKYGGEHKVKCLRIYDYALVNGLKELLRKRLSEEQFEWIKGVYHRFV